MEGVQTRRVIHVDGPDGLHDPRTERIYQGNVAIRCSRCGQLLVIHRPIVVLPDAVYRQELAAYERDVAELGEAGAVDLWGEPPEPRPPYWEDMCPACGRVFYVKQPKL